MILDTHQHFWQVSRGDYHWMSEEASQLCRDYFPDELRPHLRKAGVSQTILVQAAQTVTETDFLLDLAASTDFVAGVVGWLDLDSRDFPSRLAHYRTNPRYLGLRPMLHDLPDDDWILRPIVLANLAHLAEQRFPFEFLTYPRHLSHVLVALNQTPNLHALLDHLSKPPIAAGVLEPWKSQVAQLAEFPNLFCKLSGMITEADHACWTPENLRPYIEHVLDVFGEDRIMFGSDWPVCNLAGSYAEVCNVLRTILADHLSARSMKKVFYSNGARFYSI